MNQSKANRRRGMRASLLFVVLAAFFFCQINAPIGGAQTIGIETIFDIVPDTSTFTALPQFSSGVLPAAGTPFYIQGRIFLFRTVNQATCAVPAGARTIGTWRAWGVTADNGRLVINQSLTIDAIAGTLEVQGTTGVVQRGGGATPAIFETRGEPFTGPTEILSLTGGASVYRAFNGEVQIRPYCQPAADITRPFRYDRAFCLGFIEGKRKSLP